MLITQYILNLDQKPYVYIGSGVIILSGSANIAVTNNYGNYTEQFYLGEYVYDLEHNVWQIVAIQGDVSNPVYVCTKLGETKEFYGYELVKFSNETSTFNNIYDEEISKYLDAIDRLNTIGFASAPPTINLFLLKFNVGEYVFDINGDVWQIVAVQGSVSDPIFVGTKQQTIKNFFENEIIPFTNQTSAFNNILSKDIVKYQNAIDRLNSFVVIYIPPELKYFALKFTVGEYVFDKKQDVWQIVAVLGTITYPQYEAVRLNYKKLFYENEIIRFSSQTIYFNQEYQKEINTYAGILDSLNAITTY